MDARWDRQPGPAFLQAPLLVVVRAKVPGQQDVPHRFLDRFGSTILD
jgi:hypothetical protein